jgi:hypothetical protein
MPKKFRKIQRRLLDASSHTVMIQILKDAGVIGNYRRIISSRFFNKRVVISPRVVVNRSLFELTFFERGHCFPGRTSCSLEDSTSSRATFFAVYDKSVML